MKKALIFLMWINGIVPILAQDFQRMAPQVTSTTFVIDQNTDKKKLKEQLLQAVKNLGEEQYLAYIVIMDGCIRAIKDKRSITISKQSNGSLKAELESKEGKKDGVSYVENELVLAIKLMDKLLSDSSGNSMINILKRIHKGK